MLQENHTEISGAVITDARGIVRRWDDTLSRFFGVAGADAIGQHVLTTIEMQPPSPAELGEVWSMLTDQRDGTESRHFDIDVLHRTNGQSIPITVTVALGTGDEKHLVFLYIQRRVDLEAIRHHSLAQASRIGILIDHMKDGILVEDQHRCIAIINTPFCEMFGIPVDPSSLIGQDCSRAAEESKDLFADPVGFVAGVNATLDFGQLRTADELPMRDGRTLERDFIPIRIDGSPAGHMWVYRDITERREALETLRKNEAKIQMLYEKAQSTRFELIRQLAHEASRLAGTRNLEELAQTVEDLLEKFVSADYTGLYLIDPETSRLRLFSAKGFNEEERRIAELTAMDRHPGTVMRTGQMIHVSDVEADPDQRTQSSPRSFSVLSRLYLPVMGRNGCVGSFGLVSASKERFGPEEIELLSFVSAVAGVTYENIVQAEELRTAQAELRLRNRAIISSSNGIIITDGVGDDHPISFVNPAFERISGYTADEVMGRNPRFLYGNESDQAGLLELRAALHEGRECKVVLRNYTKQGVAYWSELSISPILSADGVPSHHIGIQTDVTERMHAQELLEAARDEAVKADRAKSEFLATMSHEIRTPMNGVIGAAELLAETTLHEVQREYVDTIVGSGNHLLHIINDILDLSKIEAGKLELLSEPFSFRSLIDELLRFFAITVAQRSVTMRAEIDASVPDRIIADPLRLRQVLLNILSNAVKFTEKGSIVLTATAVGDGELPRKLNIEVRDTGIGMTKDLQNRIFEPFSQADSSSTRLHGGTGLGLAITAQIIRLLGGSIRVSSTVGSGSCFSMEIDLVLNETASQSPEDPPTDSKQILLPLDASELHVLIVEDVSINRLILARMLEQHGVKPDIATNGYEAIDSCAGTSYDIILMDIQMPMMDGLMATRGIRSMFPATNTPMIIAITAGAIAGEREKCIAAGMDDFLVKPLKRRDIQVLIEKAITHRSSRKRK